MSGDQLLESHAYLCNKARELMTRKNHDYTSSSGDPFANFRGSSYLGIDPVLGVMLRMQDKIMRVRTFVEKGDLKVKEESVEDAFIDLINYVVLAYGLVKETSAKQPQPESPAGDGIVDFPLYSGASAREWMERQKNSLCSAPTASWNLGGNG